jgi:hypothetical protein
MVVVDYNQTIMVGIEADVDDQMGFLKDTDQ